MITQYRQDEIYKDQAIGNYAGSKPLKNAQQELFANEYLIDLSPKYALIRAGYAESTANSRSHIYMNDPDIKARVRFLMKQREDRLTISQDRVLTEIAKIAFGDITDFMVIDGKSAKFADLSSPGIKSMTGAISSIKAKGKGEKEIKMHDKMRALELLMKHLNLEDPKKSEREDEKIKILKTKNMVPEEGSVIDDGFVAAMQGMAEDIFDDEVEAIEGMVEEDEEDEGAC